MSLVPFSTALIGTALLSAPTLAQTAPAATVAHAQTATTTKTTKTNVPIQRTAKSIDCSKQADAKHIHGKARKTFMSTCKKA